MGLDDKNFKAAITKVSKENRVSIAIQMWDLNKKNKLKRTKWKC